MQHCFEYPWNIILANHYGKVDMTISPTYKMQGG